MNAQSDLANEALSVFMDRRSDAPEKAARFLKSFAHRDRLKVLCGLLDGERTVAEIEAQVGASQSAISQHLARLRNEGVLQARREGRQIYYSIADQTVQDLIELLYRKFCSQ